MEILAGAVVGVVANLLVGGRPRKRGPVWPAVLANTALGALGAGLSWVVLAFITGEKPEFGFDPGSLFAAVVGAVVLLLLCRLIHGRPAKTP
ncbi:hypothetical protein GCM10010492_01270 [Saccharothrix mutabilis subsp. mutabilis]|uniref:GlsB/YeaQ/YmgE family stress response membrane protein n=1 Tax=Saccharothrix mutabilis subsp. mutabilis TaxID=66855 RepID=A0ABN0SZD8_9PSEU